MDFIFRAVAALMIAPSVLFGCSVQSSIHELTPDETVVAFDNANQQKDIDTSKSYVDREVLNGIESGKFWWIGSYANFINNYDKDTKKVSPIRNSLKIKGDLATIDVLITHQDNTQTKKTYNLVKQDGEWKITMSE